MVSSSLQKEILKELGKLKEREQHQVLNFTRHLARTVPRGTSGRTLLQFSSGIKRDDLKRMANAIEEGCERVNLDEW